MEPTLFADRYLLQDVLGEGAVATVYRALDRETGDLVAVKVQRDIQDSEDAARLWVELRSLQRVQHPNTIRSHEMGRTEEGLHYIAMELLEGRTLRARLLDDVRLSMEAALPLLEQIFSALEACHAHGIIHRDVKPENVVLLAPDEQTLKLIDFGMAKILHDFASLGLTQPHQIFGTPEYMSPERAKGEPPTAASDIYSTGILAFEMLAGVRPFGGQNPMDVLRHQIDSPVPRFADLKPPVSIPRELRGVVRRCLRKAPLQRPSASNVLQVLRRLREGPAPTWRRPSST